MTNFNDPNYYHVNFGADSKNDTTINKWKNPNRIKNGNGDHNKNKESIEKRTRNILGKYTDLLNKESSQSKGKTKQ